MTTKRFEGVLYTAVILFLISPTLVDAELDSGAAASQVSVAALELAQSDEKKDTKKPADGKTSHNDEDDC